MTNKKETKNKINIEIKEDVANGLYSNLVVINHSPSEFVFDFITMMPGFSKAKVRSRIVLAPQHAKKLMKILNQNVESFEKKNGVIKTVDAQTMPLDFGGPKAQA